MQWVPSTNIPINKGKGNGWFIKEQRGSIQHTTQCHMYAYLSKAGCIDWLQLLPGTKVKVVVIDGASWKTDTFLVVVIALQPVGDQA